MVMSNEDKKRSQTHFWIKNGFQDTIIEQLLVVFQNLSVNELIELTDAQVNQLIRDSVVHMKIHHQTLARNAIQRERNITCDSPILNKYFV